MKKLKIRAKFKLREGESSIQQGNNEICIVADGARTYLWIGGKICYGTLSGMKTLETLASSIYKALGHEPKWAKRERKRKLTAKEL
jgi:hypothetical protein